MYPFPSPSWNMYFFRVLAFFFQDQGRTERAQRTPALCTGHLTPCWKLLYCLVQTLLVDSWNPPWTRACLAWGKSWGGGVSPAPDCRLHLRVTSCMSGAAIVRPSDSLVVRGLHLHRHLTNWLTEEPCYPYGGNHPWIIKIIAATVSRQHPSRTIVPMTPNFTDTHYDPSPHSLSSPTHHPSSSVQCWLSEVTNSWLLLSCCSFHLITVS